MTREPDFPGDAGRMLIRLTTLQPMTRHGTFAVRAGDGEATVLCLLDGRLAAYVAPPPGVLEVLFPLAGAR